MKTIKQYIVLTFIGLILSSCDVDTVGSVQEYKDVNITDYSSIEIASGFTAYITFSNTEESIKIIATNALHDLIIATKVDNKLILKLSNDGVKHEHETLNVYITTKSINDFTISNSNIYLKNTLIEGNAKIKTGDGNSIFSGKVDVDYLEIKTSSNASTSLDLSGSVNILNADLGMSADLSGYDLHVEDLKMKMDFSLAKITVNKTIDIEATRNSILSYKGNATIINENLDASTRLIKVE